MRKKIVAMIVIGLIFALYASYTVYDNWVNRSDSEVTESDNEGVNLKPEIGTRRNNVALDFTLQNLEGKEVKLTDYFGKSIVLNFWSSDCPPCRDEMPALDEFYLNNKDNIVVIGVNLGQDISTVRDFINEGGYSFPILLDTKVLVAQTYGIMYMPTTYFINEDGIIEDIHIGLLTLEDLQKRYNK
ncbi:TlpA disulfide reductase family protein [Alkaliphilus peptidifermentans]|uniref:Peroxiredoxin n=1 Tax=Alkaliphilus peptidifermentans DSM 18978 TaxID=1120976 RepID=A0A1G5HZB8_9FIRM|nr:TlpA disulfide reductase family protein [Alkaliphilus peptidifermentans]SCY69041.1 Peroxiredoxin [Alkaliphilus peptidifermentans DSM 18978]